MNLDDYRRLASLCFPDGGLTLSNNGSGWSIHRELGQGHFSVTPFVPGTNAAAQMTRERIAFLPLDDEYHCECTGADAMDFRNGIDLILRTLDLPIVAQMRAALAVLENHANK